METNLREDWKALIGAHSVIVKLPTSRRDVYSLNCHQVNPSGRNCIGAEPIDPNNNCATSALTDRLDSVRYPSSSIQREEAAVWSLVIRPSFTFLSFIIRFRLGAPFADESIWYNVVKISPILDGLDWSPAACYFGECKPTAWAAK